MKKLIASAICLLLVISLAACGASNKDSAITDMGAENYYSEHNGGIVSDESASEAQSNITDGEKIIKTVDLSVDTKEYDKYISSLTSQVSAAGGYIESSSSDMGGYGSGSRYSCYVVRVPANKLDSFLASSEEYGKIVRKTENQENVTFEYIDLESRIEAYKTEKATLTNLLEKAASLENVLAVQERLSEVNYQIESYTSQLKVLENRVSYSTVTLNISEVERVTQENPSLWEQIKNRFFDNFDSLKETVREIIVGFIGGLPIIIPCAVIIAAAILIIKKLIKRRRNKKAQ